MTAVLEQHTNNPVKRISALPRQMNCFISIHPNIINPQRGSNLASKRR